MAITTTNPATGETVKVFDEISDEELERCLARAETAFRRQRKTTFEQRSAWMSQAAALLDDDQASLAALMTLEMGKTLRSARAEVAKCARGCRYYAEHAEALLADEPADHAAVGASAAYARYQPLGVVLAIMPWNFPLWQVVRFAAPALMAGNVGLLKHASNVPQTALYLSGLFERAGFPEGAFHALLIGSSRVERVVRDRRVAAVTLTGSGPAGAAVAAVAGETIKPSVLELGGSDAFIVMPSADLEAAAAVATTARCQNNGQSCIAGKRFIVHEAIAD
jgi:succinate-semialdehyde dehydrogenase/glutarate-semialdehyde dehydrogenase